MDPQELPPEIIEHILGFTFGPTQQEDEIDTVLACALVCKAWLSPARHQLFPTGILPFEIQPPQAARDFANILQSPLCTFDLGLINTLSLKEYDTVLQPRHIPPRSFLAPLSALDAVPLPSLNRLKINGAHLKTTSYKDAPDDSPPPSILSRIKTLEIQTIFLPPFVWTADVIQLCTSLEAVTVYGNPHHREPNCEEDLTTFPPPPQTLKSLNLDVVLFQDMARWFMACQPNHTNITTLIIDNFEWSDKYGWDLWRFLDAVGPNLEEFEVNFSSFAYGYHQDQNRAVPELNDHTPPINRFAKNVSLKKFTIGAPLHIITQFLPFFFEPAHFAPQLEVFEIFISSLLNHLVPLLRELAPLDERILLRPLLRRVIFFPGNISLRFWGEMENLIRKYLPGCAERGILEFRSPRPRR